MQYNILYQHCTQILFETGTYIYSGELKGPCYGFGSCQKNFYNLKYLDWLKMLFRETFSINI